MELYLSMPSHQLSEDDVSHGLAVVPERDDGYDPAVPDRGELHCCGHHHDDGQRQSLRHLWSLHDPEIRYNRFVSVVTLWYHGETA